MVAETNVPELMRDFLGAVNAGSRSATNAVAFKLLAAQAPLGERWRDIGRVLLTNGEIVALNRAMELFVSQTGEAPGARFEQAVAFAQGGNLDRARTAMETIAPDVPNPPGHAYFVGTLALNLGESDEARMHLLRALEHNPQLGQAMLSLASSGQMGNSEPIGDRILESAERMKTAPPFEQAQFHYAAGKVHFDRREPDQAWLHFSQGARMMRALRPYKGLEDANLARECRDGFTSDYIDSVREGITADTSRPIFVTGLPRSGTTLLEQALVGHSAVAAGQELNSFVIMQRDLRGFGASALQRFEGSPNDLAELYLHLASERFGGAGRFVDKSLNSSRFVGLIASLLPRSKMIWVRRDPLDCAWSAYRTYFLRGVDWSWDLLDIAQHFALEDELFEHWTGLLPDLILQVQYEALVRDPEAQLRRILDFCELTPEPAVFNAHELPRAVTTASVMQVRQPINKDAIDASASYVDYLRPFAEEYARLTAARRGSGAGG